MVQRRRPRVRHRQSCPVPVGLQREHRFPVDPDQSLPAWRNVSSGLCRWREARTGKPAGIDTPVSLATFIHAAWRGQDLPMGTGGARDDTISIHANGRPAAGRREQCKEFRHRAGPEDLSFPLIRPRDLIDPSRAGGPPAVRRRFTARAGSCAVHPGQAEKPTRCRLDGSCRWHVKNSDSRLAIRCRRTPSHKRDDWPMAMP
jgi:hypothetical protein